MVFQNNLIMPIATIIGARGFIGRAVTQHLNQAGWDCWLPERTTTWPNSDRNLGHIFYCAGMTADYYQRAGDTIDAHAGLLAKVLQSCRYESLVYLSSTRLYDEQVIETLADESASLRINPHVPRHLYDLSKLAGESLCHALGGGRARVARLACVYDDAHDREGFLPTLMARLTQIPPGGVLSVASSPHGVRDYVHLPDVVRALVDIALRGTRPTYNVASGENTSNAQLADWIHQRARRTIRFENDDMPLKSPVVSIERLAHEFSWYPRPVEKVITPLLQAIAGTV